jgi:hypothetical protein
MIVSNPAKLFTRLSPEQEVVRARCFHPTGTFAEFKTAEIEQSVPERFEKIVGQYADRIAVKMGETNWSECCVNSNRSRMKARDSWYPRKR